MMVAAAALGGCEGPFDLVLLILGDFSFYPAEIQIDAIDLSGI
jgi:hypothetical protein